MKSIDLNSLALTAAEIPVRLNKKDITIYLWESVQR